MNYADYVTLVKTLVTDTNNAFANDDPYAVALGQAAYEYSMDNPRKLVQQYTSDGTRLFDLPPSWDNELSMRSFQVEYPPDGTALQDRIFDVQMVMLWQTPTGSKLRFRAEQWIDIVPSTGDKFWLRYFGLHNLSTTGVTIPDSHFYALGYLAASKLAMIMASRMTGQGSVNITGGQGQYRTQSQDWLALSKTYYAEYQRLIKPEDGDAQKPSAIFVSPTTSELHSYPQGLWPRDNDGRKNLYN